MNTQEIELIDFNGEVVRRTRILQGLDQPASMILKFEGRFFALDTRLADVWIYFEHLVLDLCTTRATPESKGPYGTGEYMKPGDDEIANFKKTKV